MRCTLTACLLCCSLAFADDPQSARVEGTVLVPQERASFKDRVLELRLYEHDPRLAGAAAKLIDKLEIKKHEHEQGKETKTAFVLGAKAKVDPKLGYYVTCFVLDGDKRTHIGEASHVKGLCNVLTRGGPNKVEFKVRAVNK